MNPLSHIDTWIFDVNGTIIFNPPYYTIASYRHIFLQQGHLPPDNKTLRQLWFSNSRSETMKAMGIDTDRYWTEYNSVYNAEEMLKLSSFPYDDNEVIGELARSGNNVAALTQAPLDRALIEARIASPFLGGNIVSASELGLQKPDPRSLLGLIQRFNSRKNSINRKRR